jgi:chromate transport protein ChrA
MDTIITLLQIVVVIVVIVGIWKVFEKAEQPGWAALVPIYNAYVLLKIAGRPGWWLLLLIIPLVNIVILIILPFDIAGKFGKGMGYGFGLLFLPYVFYPILGFGDARYRP